MKLSDEQLSILRHMLGINVRDTPKPQEYRDYYCAEPGDAELHELARLGMVEMYATQGGYEWFRTTETGKSAARASQQARLLPKPKRVYRRWLAIRDADADLTFRDFLTDPAWDEVRRTA